MYNKTNTLIAKVFFYTFAVKRDVEAVKCARPQCATADPFLVDLERRFRRHQPKYVFGARLDFNSFIRTSDPLVAETSKN